MNGLYVICKFIVPSHIVIRRPYCYNRSNAIIQILLFDFITILSILRLINKNERVITKWRIKYWMRNIRAKEGINFRLKLIKLQLINSFWYSYFIILKGRISLLIRVFDNLPNQQIIHRYQQFTHLIDDIFHFTIFNWLFS